MEIRLLTGEDVDALLRFYLSLSPAVCEFFRPFAEITRGVIHDHLAGADSRLHLSLGLLDKERIVGHAFILRAADPNPIFGIGLNQDYHGRGGGTVLARELLDRYDRRYAGSVTLTVLKRNKKAVRMYRRFGFRIRGDHTFRETGDSYLMVRNPTINRITKRGSGDPS